MRRVDFSSSIALACALSLAPIAVSDRAILRDGSSREIAEPELANASDTTWPGWIALKRTTTVREDDLATSMLGIDDGQVIGGGFNVVQDALWWRSRAIGAIQVDLERVAWIGPPALAGQPAPVRDHVSLINGDHVDGFVNALQADRGVEIETGTGGASPTRTWYDLSKIASIQLAPRPRPATGWRLWLRDGSVIDMDAWKREGSRVSLRGLHLPGAAPRVMIAWDEVLGIQRNSSCVTALSSLPWKAIDATDTPRLAPAQIRVNPWVQPIDVRSFDLHGPGTFVARVPDGRWVLDLTLAVPAALAGRTGCTVQMLAGDRELVRVRLGPGTKPTPVHAAIEGGDLRVVISESAHGALGAAVRLDDAMLVPVTGGEAAPTPAPTNAPASAAGSTGPG
ncbi:MAG: hypothetical protein ACKPEA_00495 [Planctomycetota bacterium]